MPHAATLVERCMLAPLLVSDEVEDRGGAGADVEHLWPVSYLSDDRLYPVFQQQVGERCLGLDERFATDEVRAKARQIPQRPGGIEFGAPDPPGSTRVLVAGAGRTVLPATAGRLVPWPRFASRPV